MKVEMSKETNEGNVGILKKEYYAKFKRNPMGKYAKTAWWLRQEIDKDVISSSQLKSEKKRSKRTTVEKLKEKYIEAFGYSCKGPKANDPKWLREQINERERVVVLKEEYKRKFHKGPRGRMAADAEWLQAQIEDDECYVECDKSGKPTKKRKYETCNRFEEDMLNEMSNMNKSMEKLIGIMQGKEFE